MKRGICILASVFSSLIFLSSCSATEKTADYGYVKDERANSYFNTTSFVLIYYDKSLSGEKERAENLFAEIDEYVKSVEYSLSATIEGGDVYRFNNADAGETVEISSLTYEVFEKTLALYSLTEGAYNPAVYNLVDLWGFSPRILSGDGEKKPYDRELPYTTLPEKKYTEAFAKLTDYGNTELYREGDKFYVRKSENCVEVDGIIYDMQIDLGGYGKGYAADGVSEIIRKAGFEYGYVSLGGSSLSMLKKPVLNKNESEEWSIKFTYPTSEGAFFGEWFGQVDCMNAGVSTSGDYERFYRVGDRAYCHIIDAKKGEPISTDICSAVVIGGSAAENDALTTALCVMGKDKAKEFTEKNLLDRKVLYVYKNSQEEKFDIYTNVERDKFTLNSSYEDIFRFKGVGNGLGGII